MFSVGHQLFTIIVFVFVLFCFALFIHSQYCDRKRSVLDEDPAMKEDISLTSFMSLNLDLNEDGAVDLNDWTQAGGSEQDFQVVDLNGMHIYLCHIYLFVLPQIKFINYTSSHY